MNSKYSTIFPDSLINDIHAVTFTHTDWILIASTDTAVTFKHTDWILIASMLKIETTTAQNHSAIRVQFLMVNN